MSSCIVTGLTPADPDSGDSSQNVDSDIDFPVLFTDMTYPDPVHPRASRGTIIPPIGEALAKDLHDRLGLLKANLRGPRHGPSTLTSSQIRPTGLDVTGSGLTRE